ncbi:MAG: hypothetical protein MJY57_01035 [Bacteroidales bacterium]|nr:hypothetical protein [Bacteroidales bacterium]
MAENEKINEIVDEIKDKTEDIKEKAQEKLEDLKEKTGDLKDKAQEKAEDLKAKAQVKIDEIKAEIDDYTAEIDPEDVKKNKFMAVLAYIGILVIIPIICAKDSKFARFHANQGLVLCIIGIVAGILSRIKLIGWIFKALGLVVIVLAIVGIVYAIQGKAKELPVIGNCKILK